MQIGRLNHVGVATPSIEESVKLYRDFLGATKIHEPFDLPEQGVRVCFVDVPNSQIELIDKPLLMIAGSKADSLYMTEDAFAKAAGAKDKELFKIEGATHIETYWVPKYVDATMGKLNTFYARTL